MIEYITWINVLERTRFFKCAFINNVFRLTSLAKSAIASPIRQVL
ncbi:hypothetical protein [Latilactobacillus sakei]|nr:hypothetical protein [Latilactobacillus sakei]